MVPPPMGVVVAEESGTLMVGTARAKAGSGR